MFISFNKFFRKKEQDNSIIVSDSFLASVPVGVKIYKKDQLGYELISLKGIVYVFKDGKKDYAIALPVFHSYLIENEYKYKLLLARHVYDAEMFFIDNKNNILTCEQAARVQERIIEALDFKRLKYKEPLNLYSYDPHVHQRYNKLFE